MKMLIVLIRTTWINIVYLTVSIVATFFCFFSGKKFSPTWLIFLMLGFFVSHSLGLFAKKCEKFFKGELK